MQFANFGPKSYRNTKPDVTLIQTLAILCNTISKLCRLIVAYCSYSPFCTVHFHMPCFCADCFHALCFSADCSVIEHSVVCVLYSNDIGATYQFTKQVADNFANLLQNTDWSFQCNLSMRPAASKTSLSTKPLHKVIQGPCFFVTDQ